MNTQKLRQIVSYLVFASVGAGVMYGVWYVSEAEQTKHDLTKAHVELVACQGEVKNAQAEAISLKTAPLK